MKKSNKYFKCILNMTLFTMISYVVSFLNHFTYDKWNRLSRDGLSNPLWWLIFLSVLIVPFIVHLILVPKLYKDFVNNKLCSILTVVAVSVIMIFVTEGFMYYCDINLNDDFSGFFHSFNICYGVPLANLLAVILSIVLQSIIKRKR